MDKPLSMKLAETKRQIADVINNSGLHICVIEPIVRDIADEVSMLAQRQAEIERKEYEASISAEKEE